MAALEAEAEAIMDMVGRRSEQQNQARQQQQQQVGCVGTSQCDIVYTVIFALSFDCT